MSCLPISNLYDHQYIGDLRNALEDATFLSCHPNHCRLNSSIGYLYLSIENTLVNLRSIAKLSSPSAEWSDEQLSFYCDCSYEYELPEEGEYPVHFFYNDEPAAVFDGLQPLDLLSL